MEHAAQVVIVGGGIAGICAAQRLLEQGFNDVVILEGDDRLGGRIYTKDFANGPLEIGAQWIHGEVQNPVFELALQNGLLYYTKGAENDVEDDYLFCLSDGTYISPNVIDETSLVLDNIFNEAEKFAREQIEPMRDEQTVGDFVKKAFTNYISKTNDSDEVKRMKDGLFNWRLTMEKTENGCASVHDMSTCAWGEYVLCAGEGAVELKRGYQPILDLFLRKIPSSCIRLRTHVKQIVWNDGVDSSKVKVVTSNDEIFNADHVIVTCSLGYLKSHMNSLFEPCLPEVKVNSISRLGYGTVNKIFLEFEKPFWESKCGGIQLAWLPDEKIELECMSNGQHDDLGDWYKAIHGFDTIIQQPSLLCGWIAGTEAELMESMPDELLINICHELLQKFTGNYKIEKPTKIIRTKWFSDPYALGSYSYRRTGSSAGDSDEIAKPLPSQENPRLLFSGEATHHAYYSTTHGALLSGQREADRIIRCYKKDYTSPTQY